MHAFIKKRACRACCFCPFSEKYANTLGVFELMVVPWDKKASWKPECEAMEASWNLIELKMWDWM
jgi:hypothetical protein